MKKKLLVVGVAATLSAIATVSRAAIMGLNVAPTQPHLRRTEPWADGGKYRGKRRFRTGTSPAERLMDRAESRRKQSKGA